MIDDNGIYRLDEVSSKAKIGIVRIAANLFSAEAKADEEYIKNVALLMAQHKNMIVDPDRSIASVSTVFTAFLDALVTSPRREKGDLYQLMSLFNHIPILDTSHLSEKILGAMTRYLEEEPQNRAFFDRLQLLGIYLYISHFEAARELIDEMEKSIQDECFASQVLFGMCKLRLYEQYEDYDDTLAEYLSLAVEVYWEAGPQSAIYLLLEWMCSIRYLQDSKYYVGILSNLYRKLQKKSDLNMIGASFQLFCMANPAISTEFRQKLQKELMLHGTDYLNSYQLHRLYLFAGHTSELDALNFYHSVQSFKDSNLYMQRSWQNMIAMAAFLRKHSTPLEFKIAMAFLENKIMELAKQNSFRNELFVQNIQDSYQKIEYLYNEVDELSLTDALTGLRNRRFMDNNLLQILALLSRHNTQTTFAMMDIDWFKQVNDTYGHHAGDLVLRDLAKIFSNFFRKSDIVIRYGGEEFLAILFDVGDNSGELLENLRKKVEKKTFVFQESEIKITISIGWVLTRISNHVTPQMIDSYIVNADKAMYKAKAGGRNLVIEYKADENGS